MLSYLAVFIIWCEELCCDFSVKSIVLVSAAAALLGFVLGVLGHKRV